MNTRDKLIELYNRLHDMKSEYAKDGGEFDIRVKIVTGAMTMVDAAMAAFRKGYRNDRD